MQRVDGLARRLVHPAARLAAAGARRARRSPARLGRAYAAPAGSSRAAAIACSRGIASLAVCASRCRRRRVSRSVGDALRRARRANAERARGAVAALAQNLAHLNPQAVLERGYAIVTTADGAIVQDATRACGRRRRRARVRARRRGREDQASARRSTATGPDRAVDGCGRSGSGSRRITLRRDRDRRRRRRERASAALRGDPRRRRHDVGVLRAMAQRVVHQHERQHRLGDRRRADADAGIVAAVRVDDHRIARLVDRAAIEADRRRRLHRDRDDDVLAGRDAAEDAAGVVRQKSLRRHLVGMLGAALRDAREAGADLDALHRVDAHHRRARGRRRGVP